MSKRQWLRRASEYVLQTPWISVRKEAYTSPTGKEIDDFYVVERRDFVVVVAKTIDERYIVVSQFRHGVGAVRLNFPMGFIEKGEDAHVAAERELREETGYYARTLTYLGTFKQAPALMNTEFSVFLAHDCQRISGSEIRIDPEINDVMLIEIDKIKKMIELREIDDAASVFSFMLAKESPAIISRA